MKLILYGTDCCQLCDEALGIVEETLDNRDYELETVDISSSDELMAKYAYSIPVLQLNCIDLNWPFSSNEVLTFVTNNR